MKFTTLVISGGRITIPDEIRGFMHIDEGDIVEVEVNGVHKQKQEIHAK